MSPNAPAHPAGTNTLSLRRHRHDHPLTRPFRMTQSLEFRLDPFSGAGQLEATRSAGCFARVAPFRQYV